MARTSSKKNVVKPVNYLNKDFSDFRDNLIDFAKQYFPNTYNNLTFLWASSAVKIKGVTGKAL